MNLDNFWYRKNFLSYLLLPVSLVYRAVMALRRILYRVGMLKTTHFSVPVIVIGNITVGGTGKTPVVIALAQWLRQEGWAPGIVSRGYGGKVSAPCLVTAGSDPRLVGDEPVLLAAKTGCPLVIAKNRPAAVAALLRDHHCNVVISDDGLQHLALGRDVEVVVIDGERGLGNGFCLPAGPLREPASRLKSVNFIINNAVSPPLKKGGEGGFFSKKISLNPRFAKGKISQWNMNLMPGAVYQLIDTAKQLAPGQLHTAVHAVAAIGNPARFFTTLKNLGFTIIAHPFPDHYYFQPADLNFGDDLPIIMTEKDAVKCRAFADDRYWCLPVQAQLPEIGLRNLADIFLR